MFPFLSKPLLTEVVNILLFAIIIGIMVAIGTNIRTMRGGMRPKNMKNRASFAHIWMYWEDRPGTKRPEYLKLCYQTVRRHCQKDFQIHLLNEKTVYKYLPDLRRDIRRLGIPQQTDYIRLKLLKTYGGLWMDADTIVLKSLAPLIEYLKEYDFVGFGCHTECQRKQKDTWHPANWMMASRRDGLLVTLCLNKADRMLDSGQQLSYHELGRELLWSSMYTLRSTKPGWKYMHYSHRCSSHDSDGVKYENERMLSKRDPDPKCAAQQLFVPIYNTAPGFPKWFLQLTKEQLLSSDMLISKFLRGDVNAPSAEKLSESS